MKHALSNPGAAARLAAAVAIFGASFLAWTPEARAQDACRMDDVLRCWHIAGVFGEAAPNRIMNIVRMRERDHVGTAIRDIELVQAIENPASAERYVIWNMRIDCDKGAFQVQSTIAGLADGRAVPKENERSDWVPLDQGRYGEMAAAAIACPSVPGVSRSQRSELLHKSILSDAYRAADAVDWLRKTFWSAPGEFR